MASANEILFVSRDKPDDETRRLLESRGFQMTMLDDVTKASQSINERRLSAIVLDVRIGSDAIDFIRSIRSDKHPVELPVLAVGEWGTGEPSLAFRIKLLDRCSFQSGQGFADRKSDPRLQITEVTIAFRKTVEHGLIELERD